MRDRYLVGLLLCIGVLLVPGAHADVVVADVEIRGAVSVDPGAVRSAIAKTSGTFSEADRRALVKSVFSTGFFEDVELRRRVNEQGQSILVVAVREKPRLRRSLVQGNKGVKDGDLAKVLTVTGSRFVDQGKLSAIARRGEQYYQTRGYLDAKIGYEVLPVGDGFVDVTFSVEEGERFTVGEVRFDGTQLLPVDEIIPQLATQEYRWWSSWITGSGRLAADAIENDKAVVRQALLDHGLLDGSVGEPVITRDGDQLTVTFPVVEGAQYRVGAVRFSGDEIPSGDTELRASGGKVFSASDIRADAFALSERFTAEGFAFANVVPLTMVRRDAGEVDVTFEATRGALVTVNRIEIRGNQKSYDNVVRRQLVINEQEQFSSKKIERSRTLLRRTGYFEEATITTRPTDRPDEVDLVVTVREAPTGSFSAGVGISSSDGPLLNARLSEDNILGTGRKVVINADIGAERNNLLLSLQDERFRDSYLSLGVDAFKNDREFDDFDRDLTGGGFSVGYPLEQIVGEWGQDIQLSTRYELTAVDIANVDAEDASDLVIESEGSSTASSIIPRVVRNTINNPLNPTRGSRQSVSFEYAGLGGDERYTLFEARQQWYTPLIGEDTLVFSWRTSFGYGENQRSDEPFPLFKRYFPGGINSVRGFENRSLGPKDSRGNEYGGAKELVNNLEVIFPLARSAGLRGVLFFDAGQAFDDNESIEISELRKAYGFGLRWASPLGPLRVEFGFPVDREEDEDSFVTLFSFGAPL